MNKYRYISYSAVVLVSLLTVSCLKERFAVDCTQPARPKNFDEISLSATSGNVECDAEKLEYTVTVSKPGTPATKAGLVPADSLVKAEVECVSYVPGKNPEMSMIRGGGPATKSIYDQITTRDLNSNFLRLDEVVGSGDVATYNWPTWDNAQLLEAGIIATPDNTDDLFYRSVTFSPSQAYNIRTFNEEYIGGMWVPKDTIFYHTRMIGWYPLICDVPSGVGGDKAVIQFKDSRYSEYRAQVGVGRFGVVFDHVLDGGTDLMMSNMCEAQRWHTNFDADNNPTPHYRDMDKTLPESQENYHFPYGHNESNPTYSNPIYYHHYLTGIRIWAKVDQSGDNAQTNLLTWSKILAVSVINQPSTVTIALPESPSSPVFLDEYGRLVKEGGSVKVDKSAVTFGAVQSWGDYTSLPIRTELMYGVGDINHANDDYTASYPIDMTTSGDIHGMDLKYLGYCLVKPCELGPTEAEDESIVLAIQTVGGTYQAVIPCQALVEDEKTHTVEKVHVFQESKVYDITLNLKTSGTFSDFIAEEGEDRYVDLSPYDETNGTYKTANSYVVPLEDLQERFDAGEISPGYTFAGNIAGNGQAGILSQGSTTFHTNNAIIPDITKAVIEWQSNREQIFNVQYQHGYVRFQMKDATPGNAVISAIDDAGNVKWSWHIWITDEPKNVVLGGVEYMDRNLGATWHYTSAVPSSAEDKLASYGLYYQWGRKDPIPTPLAWDQHESTDITTVYDEYGAGVTDLGAYVFDQCVSLTDAIGHPMHYALCAYSPYYQHDWLEVPIDFLWGKADGSGIIKKSIYDPCPFGYRVVHEELQSLMENGSTSVTNYNGAGLLVANGGNRIFLPYAGYFGPDRNYSSNTNAGYFMGAKGDYTSGVICPNADSDANNYFSYHRLRTYISQATSWTSENIDGVESFTYDANTSGKHYVMSAASVPSRRDYGNRKTAGSVRCIADGSYVHQAFSHIKSLTPSLSPGGVVNLDLNGGVNLGAIQTATLKASYTTDGGSVVDRIFKIVTNGARDYTDEQFVNNFDGNVTALLVKGTFKFNLPATLPASKYTFTLYVQEKSGVDASSSCEVSEVYISTQSIVSTVAGNSTDGAHPYAGQQFSLAVTIQAGPATTVTVNRTDFKAGTVTASSVNASDPDASGMSTITVTFNNVSIAEPGLDKSLDLSGKITMDGSVFNWSDTFHTEVWEKVGNDAVDTSNPYLTLEDAAAADAVAIRSNATTNRYLYNNNGTPAVTSTYGATDNYLWSLTSSGALQNVGNGRYITIGNGSVTFTDSPVNLTFTLNNTNLFYIARSYYYMRDNYGTIGTSTSTGTDRRWRLYPVTRARYIDPHIEGGTLVCSGDGLYEGHPVVNQEFTATYKVTVSDADAVTFGSATIGGAPATGTVVKVGDVYEVTLTADVTPAQSKRDFEFPVKVNLNVSSAALGLSNASITQYYSPTEDVWKYTLTSRTKGDKITTLAALTDEEKVFMINAGYTARYTAANTAGTGFTSATTTSTANDTQLWTVASSGSGYTIQNVESENYVVINATRSGNSWSYSTPSLGDSTVLTMSVSNGNFTISRSVTSNNRTTTIYFRQSGNTSYAGDATNSNRNWTFYKVNETYTYSAPTE